MKEKETHTFPVILLKDLLSVGPPIRIRVAPSKFRTSEVIPLVIVATVLAKFQLLIVKPDP